MSIKFTDTLDCKTRQNLPKLSFWFESIYNLATLCLARETKDKSNSFTKFVPRHLAQRHHSDQNVAQNVAQYIFCHI
jgi:hypothetical protein